MIYSLRSNGRYQLIVLSCSVVGLVYIFWQNGFAKTSVKALVMAYVFRSEKCSWALSKLNPDIGWRTAGASFLSYACWAMDWLRSREGYIETLISAVD